MISLGPISTGTLRIAATARTAVQECGQVAVFASRKTGNAVAMPYTAPSYAWHLRRHSEHLVGVYRDDGNPDLRNLIRDDLNAHLSVRRRAA